MPTPSSLTFDLSPPRRPSIDDLGGGQKAQRPDAPPDPVTMLTADDVNQWAFQIAALARVCPLAVLLVGEASGVYFISSVSAPGDAIATGAFTPTKTSTGIVTITWDPAALPASAGPPQVTPVGTVPAMASVTFGSGTCTVYLKNAAGALDSAFSLSLF